MATRHDEGFATELEHLETVHAQFVERPRRHRREGVGGQARSSRLRSNPVGDFSEPVAQVLEVEADPPYDLGPVTRGNRPRCHGL